MQLGSRYLPPENLDPHTTFDIPHPVGFPGYNLNMYSTHRVPVTSKAAMERMYSMDSTLNKENMSNVSSPKKENMFQSMFNALNGIWEHFSRVPGSFVAHANNPLSVTVVQNEGIISHEFFKSLTNRKELVDTNNMYIQDTHQKDVLGIIEKVCTFEQKSPTKVNIFNKSINKDDEFKNNTQNSETQTESKVQELIIARYEGDNTGSEKLRVTVSNNSIFYNHPEAKDNKLSKESDSDTSLNKTSVTKDSENLEEESTLENKTESTSENNISDIIPKIDTEHLDLVLASNSENNLDIPARQAVITNLLTNMWQKVIGGVTDRWLYFRTDSMESELSIRCAVSPKKRRKLNTVAKGRGRGRAKSQLRRSGVSQTRHRKERTKHDLVVEINDDYESYQESETFDRIQGYQLEDPYNCDDDGIDVPDCATACLQESHGPTTFTIADIKPRNFKPKNRRLMNTRVRYVPDCTVDSNHDYSDNRYNSQKALFRPRLISESSIDSEDSYCIVFETGSDTTFQSESDFEEENDDEQSTDDEDDNEEEEPMSSGQKVKFNLKPTVHTMIQWDYAYRAARRGPWEQMARDRDRFKSRIHCIERILNPILSTQHRSHIWQERFAFTE